MDTKGDKKVPQFHSQWCPYRLQKLVTLLIFSNTHTGKQAHTHSYTHPHIHDIWMHAHTLTHMLTCTHTHPHSIASSQKHKHPDFCPDCLGLHHFEQHPAPWPTGAQHSLWLPASTSDTTTPVSGETTWDTRLVLQLTQPFCLAVWCSAWCRPCRTSACRWCCGRGRPSPCPCKGTWCWSAAASSRHPPPPHHRLACLCLGCLELRLCERGEI